MRTDEEIEEDHSRHINYGSANILERPILEVSQRFLMLPGPSQSRSHLRDILNQDSCPSSYEQKRARSNSVDSARSCRTTTGVPHSNGFSPSDIYAQRSAEEVYKFKNNIKERFRADNQHHVMEPSSSVTPEAIVTPLDNNHYHPKLPSRESFGISRMFPSAASDENILTERSFGTLNGFGSFGVTNELAIKIPTDGATIHEPSGPEVSQNGNGENRSNSSNSSCGSNPSPSSISYHTGNSNNANTSGGEGNKTGSSHSSTSGYSTSGEGSSTVSLCNNKMNRSSSRSPGENLPSCEHLKMEEQTITSSHEPEVTSSVPVFALHPRGSFYIPLTLESTVLSPHLKGLDFMLDPEDRLPLHPVNISVCFHQGASKLKERSDNALLPTWRTKSERSDIYESFRERLY